MAMTVHWGGLENFPAALLVTCTEPEGFWPHSHIKVPS